MHVNLHTPLQQGLGHAGKAAVSSPVEEGAPLSVLRRAVAGGRGAPIRQLQVGFGEATARPWVAACLPSYVRPAWCEGGEAAGPLGRQTRGRTPARGPPTRPRRCSPAGYISTGQHEGIGRRADAPVITLDPAHAGAHGLLGLPPRPGRRLGGPLLLSTRDAAQLWAQRRHAGDVGLHRLLAGHIPQTAPCVPASLPRQRRARPRHANGRASPEPLCPPNHVGD